MKKIVLIILSLCIIQVIDAQSIRRNHKSGNLEEKVREDISVLRNNAQANHKMSGNAQKYKNSQAKGMLQDTVYCIQTKKQHGWFAPVRVISKEEASHRWLTYRFTKRNAQGNWCKMELIDGYGNYTTGGMSPYILKVGSADTDSLANADWVDRIKTECIYEFIADPTGKNVIQERAYDKDMNIIYTYSRTPIGKDSLGHNRYVGSYKDCYGLPAEMRKDTTNTYTYGTLVMLTEDIWGNDSIIEYMDAKGLKKLNSDKAAMEVFVCNKDGLSLKQQSRNSDGSLKIDNWGNCGIEYVWNDDYTMASATYMDDKWKPMRLPNLRATNGKDNVMQIRYKYDQYARETEEAFYTSDGKPDVNLVGVHKFTLTYDHHGNTEEQRYYDINGRLINNESGCAIYQARYDGKGNPTERFWFNQQEELYYREWYLYNKDGEQVLCEGYSIENGKEVLKYRDKTTDTYKCNFWSDGTLRIDSLDTKGRTTMTAFFDENMAPIFNTNNEYHKKTYEYIDKNGELIEIDKVWDEKGHLYGETPINCYFYDSIHQTKRIIQCDESKKEFSTCTQLFANDFNNLLGQYDTNIFGDYCRAGGISGVRHYYVDVLYNQKGNFASFIGRDEFNEPDYIVCSDGSLYYYKRMTAKGKDVFYDEDSKEIADYSILRDKLPKVMSIEVVDSSAYALGLRDNDVILLYGDYSVNFNLNKMATYSDFREEWTLRSVLDADKEKRLVVFRIENPSENKYRLVEIKGLKGTMSELGFLAHIRYLTSRQTERIQQAIRDNMGSENPVIAETDLGRTTPKGDKYVVLGYTEMYRSVRNKPYAVQITDPAILLGACIKDRNMLWSLAGNGENTESFERMLDSRKSNSVAYPTMNFYLAKNATGVSPMVLKDQFAGINWFDAHISDKDYKRLLNVSKQAQRDMNKILKAPSEIETKSLMSQWEIISDKESEHPSSGSLYLAKDGTCQGTITDYGTISFNEGTAVFKIDKNYDGSWSHKGSLISFTPIAKDSLTLTCIDLLGAEDDLKERTIAFLNSRCNAFRESYMSRMKLIHQKWEDEFFIRTFVKDTLTIEDGHENGVRFVRVKNKPKSVKQVKTKEKEYAKEEISIERRDLDTSPIVGKWETPIPNVPDSKFVMSFAGDGKVNLNINASFTQALTDSTTLSALFSVELNGTWTMDNDSLTIKNNPASMKIDMDLDVIGVDEETQKQLLSTISDYFESQKEQLALQLLEGNTFDGTMAISKLTSTEFEMNGNTFMRIPDKCYLVVGRIEGDKGFLVEKGYSGRFIVLEWCDWNCTQTTDEYSSEFERKKDKDKSIVLLPVEKETGSDVFKEIIHLKCPSGLLGLRIESMEVPQSYYQTQILQRYLDWKKQDSDKGK